MIKICGITSVEDAMLCNTAGADLLGFVMHRGSKRCTDTETLLAVRQALPYKPVVMVFGYDSKSFILEQVRAQRQLRQNFLLQMPYDIEGFDEIVAEIQNEPIIQGIIPVINAEKKLYDNELPPEELYPLVIIDSGHIKNAAGQKTGGGTGKVFDWSFTENLSRRYLIAGGLSAENVRLAVETTHCAGVDIAGGTEKEPGKKSAEKVFSFVKKARALE